MSKNPKKNILFRDLLKLILKESAYTLSDFNTITNKSFNEVLEDNKGVPFDITEKRKFVEKQEGFGGSGKVNFIHKRSTNEISAQIFANGTTKTYVFKKLPNKKFPGLYSYACFVHLTTPKEKEQNNINEDNDAAINANKASKNAEISANNIINNKENKNDNEGGSNKNANNKKNDIVYILSGAFNDEKVEEKQEILSDFIRRINSYEL